MNDTAPAELAPLPCPFCGGAATLKVHRWANDTIKAHYVHCTVCNANGFSRNTIDKAVEQWNTRTPAALTEATLHAIAEAVFLHIDWKASREEALRVVRLAAEAPPPAREVTEEMTERAVRAGCNRLSVFYAGHQCIYPACDCKKTPAAVRAALAAGLGEKGS